MRSKVIRRFNKNSLATVLQVMAIIILFGYPGCSSNNESKESVQDKVLVTSYAALELKANMLKHWKGLLMTISVKRPAAKQIKYFTYTGIRN
jgi:hypothetical protein